MLNRITGLTTDDGTQDEEEETFTLEDIMNH